MHWFRNAIIYQIMIDRFSGHGDHTKPDFAGGNITGIIRKLDYLKQIGFNCIWISPFLKTTYYHGYHVEDFYNVDPHFGTKKDLKELVRIAHNKGIKVIADFVPNHCSFKHPFFLDAKKNRKSRYHDWFYFKRWPNNYLCFLNLKELPKLNLDNKETRDHIVDAALYWIKEIDLDGYRLDHAIGPSHTFWKYFNKKVKKVKKDAALIGEVWFWGIKKKHLETIRLRKKHEKFRQRHQINLQDAALKEYVGELDGCLDFTFNDLAKRFFARETIDCYHFFLELKDHYRSYSNFFLPSFLDNHDMNRFSFECKNDIRKLKLASLFQFTMNQPPIVYYGTETKIKQVNVVSHKLNSDLNVRQTLPAKPDNDLFNHYKFLCEIRKKYKCLREGSFIPIDCEYPNIVAYIKDLDDERVIIAMNMSDEEQKIMPKLKDYAKKGILTDLREKKKIKYPVKIKPHDFRIGLLE